MDVQKLDALAVGGRWDGDSFELTHPAGADPPATLRLRPCPGCRRHPVEVPDELGGDLYKRSEEIQPDGEPIYVAAEPENPVAEWRVDREDLIG